MAVGDLRGTLTGNGNSVTNPSNLTGSVAVLVGDLIYVCFAQQTNLTASSVTDNLGNTYAAANAGLDGGTSTGRAFYARVTVAGTLTQVSVAASASTNDYAGLVAVIEGPIEEVSLDANPSPAEDATSSHNAPATGTLNQADSIVMCWAAPSNGTSATWSATSPNLLAGQVNNSTTIKAVIGYKKVSATTTSTPAFTSTANPTDCPLGTNSFRVARGAAPQGNLALSTFVPFVIRPIDPSAAQLALSSAAPQVAQNGPHPAYEAGIGAVAISGGAISGSEIEQVVAISVVPAQGNLALSAVAPTIVAPTIITPAQGDLSVSSVAPTVSVSDNNDITPAQGDLAITSVAPSLSLDTARTPAQGDLTLSTVAPTRVVNHAIAPAQANLALSTFAPTALVSTLRTPAQADLTLTGAAPTILVNHAIAPAQGNLSLTTDAPTRTMGAARAPAQGNLTLSSVASTSVLDTARAPAQGNLALSTFAPDVAWTDHRAIEPAQANLELTAQAPTVDAGASVARTPPAADLALSASAPTVQVTTVVIVTGRAFIARVTAATAGTLTQISATTTPSTNDYAALGAVFQGPFETVPLDVNVANQTTDITSPFTAPATGTRNQNDELVVSWGAAPQSEEWAATAPAQIAGNVNNADNVKVAIGYLPVTDTVSTSIDFTAAVDPANIVLGTFSLRRARGLAEAADLALSGFAPTVQIAAAGITVAPAQADLTLSAFAPVIVVDAARTPAQSSLALSSVAPVVVWTDHRIIAPAVGQLTLTLQPPTVDAGANVSRTPAAADLALSTFAPTAAVSDNRTIAPAHGALALSTFVPVVLLATLRTPAQADLALSTAAPLPVADTARTPGHGDLLLSAFAPTITVAEQRTPAQGNLTLTAVAATVVWTDHRTITPAQGGLSLTTQPPTVDTGASVTRTPAAYEIAFSTFAPSAARTDHRTITPAVGDLALTTQIPVVVWTDHRSIAPNVGQLSLSVQSPTVDAGANVSRSPASTDLTLSGFAPSLTFSFQFTPASANLTLSTVAPTVTVNFQRMPAQGNLTLSTFAPTLAAQYTPATANLTLSTTAPLVVWTDHRTIAPSAAQLTLSTVTAVASQGQIRTPAQGNLTLSSVAPTKIADTSRTPATVDLTLSATVPVIVDTGAFEFEPDAAQLLLSSGEPIAENTGNVVLFPSVDGARRGEIPPRQGFRRTLPVQRASAKPIQGRGSRTSAGYLARHRANEG